MSLGSRIKEKRLEHQLTQDQLSEKIFVSRQAISNWENDKSQPDLENLIMLSELYQITLDELLKGENHEMNHPKNPTKRSSPSFKCMLVLLLWSLLMVITQIVTKLPNFFLLTVYALGGTVISAVSLAKTKRLSNVYSQGENMYDTGVFLFAGFWLLIVVSVAFQVMMPGG